MPTNRPHEHNIASLLGRKTARRWGNNAPPPTGNMQFAFDLTTSDDIKFSLAPAQESGLAPPTGIRTTPRRTDTPRDVRPLSVAAGAAAAATPALIAPTLDDDEARMLAEARAERQAETARRAARKQGQETPQEAAPAQPEDDNEARMLASAQAERQVETARRAARKQAIANRAETERLRLEEERHRAARITARSAAETRRRAKEAAEDEALAKSRAERAARQQAEAEQRAKEETARRRAEAEARQQAEVEARQEAEAPAQEQPVADPEQASLDAFRDKLLGLKADHQHRPRHSTITVPAKGRTHGRVVEVLVHKDRPKLTLSGLVPRGDRAPQPPTELVRRYASNRLVAASVKVAELMEHFNSGAAEPLRELLNEIASAAAEVGDVLTAVAA